MHVCASVCVCVWRGPFYVQVCHVHMWLMLIEVHVDNNMACCVHIFGGYAYVLISRTQPQPLTCILAMQTMCMMCSTCVNVHIQIMCK